MRRKVPLVVMMLLVGLFLASLQSLSYQQEWLSGWKYRRPIMIRSSQTLEDYQVRLVLDTHTLVAAGKMKSDCGDLRFTLSDGVTELPYWIETGCNTSKTVVWVRIPLLEANKTNTIYMYYGNPAAHSASNGSKVFVFFDDFSRSTLGDRWVQTYGSKRAVSIRDGKLVLRPYEDSDSDGVYVRTSLRFMYGDYIVHVKYCTYYRDQGSDDLDADTPFISPHSKESGYKGDGDNPGEIVVYNADPSNGGTIILWGYGSDNVFDSGKHTPGCHYVVLYPFSDKACATIDGASGCIKIAKSPLPYYYIYFAIDSSAKGNWLAVNYVFVNKYSANEPVASIGSEEAFTPVMTVTRTLTLTLTSTRTITKTLVVTKSVTGRATVTKTITITSPITISSVRLVEKTIPVTKTTTLYMTSYVTKTLSPTNNSASTVIENEPSPISIAIAFTVLAAAILCTALRNR